MFSLETYLNCDLKPSQVIHSFWLFEHKDELVQKYPPSDGKWMQFYRKSQLDATWDLAKLKYRAGQLEGISSMKVSTACESPRSSNSADGVILFYCGPSNDEQRIMYIGEKLLKEMPYKSLTGSMSYKSDKQTLDGTQATGQIEKHLYKLPCTRL